MAEGLTAAAFAQELASAAVTMAEGFVRRFCPDDRLPSVVAGYRSYERTESALLRMYARLLRIGVESLNGKPLRQRLTAFLGQIRGEDYETWWSLFIADTLLATGARFEGHPLLAPLTEGQRQQVREAVDSSHVVDLAAGKLIGKPNNYWIVMARLEQARLALGLTADERIFRLALERSREVLCGNPCGFLDDDQDGRGRYDIYSFGSLLHAEPLWNQLPGEALQRAIAAHERALLTVAMPDGRGISWGRSAELTALTFLDFGAALLRHNATAERSRLLGLAVNAFGHLTGQRWADDALTVHRHRMTHWYMGEFRLLEHSLNQIAAIADAAWQFGQIAREDPALTAEARPEVLYPQREAWVQFDQRGPGVWCCRRGGLDFQLALVDGYTSDYVAFPIWPDVLEQPVDRAMACGVPNAFFGGKRYLPLRRPTNVRYEPGCLSWTTEGFTWFEDFDWWKSNADLPGRRQASVRVVGEGLQIEEHWSFASVPEALAMQIPELRVPLEIRWDCSQPHQAFKVAVGGMRDWRSYRQEIRAVHQLDIVPAREVTLRYTIAKA